MHRYPLRWVQKPMSCEDEPCPQCGQLYLVRWLDSDIDYDTWHCTACSDEWRTPVTVSTTTVDAEATDRTPSIHDDTVNSL
jgi:ribosomal protein L37AE/L43A